MKRLLETTEACPAFALQLACRQHTIMDCDPPTTWGIARVWIKIAAQTIVDDIGGSIANIFTFPRFSYVC